MNNYPKIVVDKTNELVEVLVDINFFEENELEIDSSIIDLICKKLVIKFIDGQLSEDEYVYDSFSEEEVSNLLNEIIVLGTLVKLLNKLLVCFLIN
jgi:hypothetical protein